MPIDDTYEINWDFGDGNTSDYINPSNLYENTEEGALITLTAISDFGCTDQAQLIIEYDEQEVFYIPNTFTPDGDNFNQMFSHESAYQMTMMLEGVVKRGTGKRLRDLN